MASSDVAVGKEILAYCTSCKMDLINVIVAMKGDRAHKVQCKTCKKEHVFKAPKGITTPSEKVAKVKKPRAKKSDADNELSIAAEWEKLMMTHKNAPTKQYTTKGMFILGDKLHHPTFGDGIVSKMIYPNKLEVIFQTDLKVLIYGGTVQSFH